MRGVRAVASVTLVAMGSIGLLLNSGPASASTGGLSGFLAGYEESTGGTTSESSSFTVPTVSCAPVTAKGQQGVLLAVMIEQPTELSQAALGGLAVNCNGHTSSYVTLAQAGSTVQDLPFTVKAGDTITVSLAVSESASSATVSDASQSQTVTGSGEDVGFVALGAFKVACGGNNDCEPVPELTSKAKFTGTSFDSSNLAGATHDQLTDAKGVKQMKSTAVTDSATAFSVKWLSSCGVGKLGC
jgi:hypothetical protein